MKALWIRVEAHEVDSKLVDQLATLLGIPEAYALGLYVALGGAVAEHAPDGTIADVSDTKLEVWAHWTGKRGTFAAAARTLLQTDAGMLVDWSESMGQLIERRKRDLARKAGGNSTELPRKPRGNSTATERNGTERNGTERNGTEHPASTSLQENSNKRSGDLPSAGARERRSNAASASAPPFASLRELREHSPVVDAFFARYYDGRADDKRVADVGRQLLALLAGGATYKRQLVHAYGLDRLERKIAAVFEERLNDPDKAIVVLLTKCADTSDGSAPGAIAAAEQQRTANDADRNRARELVDANAWLEEQPDLEQQIVAQLDADYPAPNEAGDDLLASARRIAREALVLARWRSHVAPDPEAAGV